MVDDRRTRTSWRPVLSCEHASNRLPERYADLVPPELLETHEGGDPGARTLARSLARTLRAPLIEGRFAPVPQPRSAICSGAVRERPAASARARACRVAASLPGPKRARP